MRLVPGSICALALMAAIQNPTPSTAYDVLASVFQFAPPSPSDPDPGIEGVVFIDTLTGAISPFFSEPANTIGLTDVAVNPLDGTVYVSSLGGTIERYNMFGESLGVLETFTAVVDGEPGPDGVNRLLFGPDGTLYAGTGSGVVAEFDPSGVRQADRAVGAGFVAGLAISPAGDLYVSTGEFFGAGVVSKIGNAGLEEVIPAGVVGGASSITYLPAIGDYNGNDETDASDRNTWAAAYGSFGNDSDGNGDGSVNAADYTVWRDNLGDHAELLVADYSPGVIPGMPGNRVYSHDLIDETGGELMTIPVPLPDPLPSQFSFPSNFPSEVLLSPEGTLLVSTSGHSQRPLNSGALLEFDRDGTFLRRIDPATADPVMGGLPPLSGIDLAPLPVIGPLALPEPAALSLFLALGGAALLGQRR